MYIKYTSITLKKKKKQREGNKERRRQDKDDGLFENNKERRGQHKDAGLSSLLELKRAVNMTFPFIFNAHDQGQYRFFSGRNNTSVGRKNIHVKNSKQSNVIGRRQEGDREKHKSRKIQIQEQFEANPPPFKLH